MSAWFAIWLLWGVAFGILEYKAVKDPNKGDTLSENLRVVLGATKKSSPIHRAFGIITFLGFIAWFTPHILLDVS